MIASRAALSASLITPPLPSIAWTSSVCFASAFSTAASAASTSSATPLLSVSLIAGTSVFNASKRPCKPSFAVESGSAVTRPCAVSFRSSSANLIASNALLSAGLITPFLAAIASLSACSLASAATTAASASAKSVASSTPLLFASVIAGAVSGSSASRRTSKASFADCWLTGSVSTADSAMAFSSAAWSIASCTTFCSSAVINPLPFVSAVWIASCALPYASSAAFTATSASAKSVVSSTPLLFASVTAGTVKSFKASKRSWNSVFPSLVASLSTSICAASLAACASLNALTNASCSIWLMISSLCAALRSSCAFL